VRINSVETGTSYRGGTYEKHQGISSMLVVPVAVVVLTCLARPLARQVSFSDIEAVAERRLRFWLAR
jgi:hypothetical protein